MIAILGILIKRTNVDTEKSVFFWIAVLSFKYLYINLKSGYFVPQQSYFD